MGQGRNNDDRCFYAFHQLRNFKLYPLFDFSNFNFHIDLLLIHFMQIIVHIFRLSNISQVIESPPLWTWVVVVVVVIVVGCRLCYGTSKIVAHISGWRVSIIVDLGPPNLGKEELGSNDLDQVASTEEGSGWPSSFLTLGLKLPRKGRLCQ